MSDHPSMVLAVDPPSSPIDPAPILTLALAAGWKVHLVHAAAPTGADPAPELELLAAQTAAFTDHGVDAEAHVMTGPPVDVILSCAESFDAAMIVVAGHRHDVDHRTVLGSFTSALLKVANRPVLVLPAGPSGSQPGFVAAVDRLIELIDRDGDAEQLTDLRQAAAAQLREPSSEAARKHLGGRLLDALHRFETEHPTLTQAINDVSYHLSGMGI